MEVTMLTPGLKTRRWSRREYDDLVARGVLTPNDRVELIEGEIVPKMPQNVPHTVGVRLTEDVLRTAFSSGFDVRPALPLAVADDSEPEPDLAVVRGNPRELMRTGQHPSTAVLVVEISDSTLAYDPREKARISARAGIPEYWIVNMRDRVLEVYREPVVDVNDPSTAHFHSRQILHQGDTIVPLAAPAARVAVADLLP
jgi:Uma2 family endonuclease